MSSGIDDALNDSQHFLMPVLVTLYHLSIVGVVFEDKIVRANARRIISVKDDAPLGATISVS